VREHAVTEPDGDQRPAPPAHAGRRHWRSTAGRGTRALALGLLLAGVAVGIAWLHPGAEAPPPAPGEPFAATPAQIARGAYLARVGDCAACHTDRGGAPYAGGKGIATPFGTVYASNLTPDDRTGIGRWTSAQFWRALHDGRSADGHLLYPAFPYPNFTEVTRADADALYAYLRTLVPAVRPNRAHALRFPYDTQAALAVWRALFFTPAAFEPQAGRSAQWNRGAYLVRGLGHCAACHSPRNAFGATSASLELSGGLIPMQNWYAPSLASPAEAGVATWPPAEIVALLQTGLAPRGATMGPMAEVVHRSTQYLEAADAAAVAVFLRALPQTAPRPADWAPPPAPVRARGAAIYKDKCAGCHGPEGEGAAAGGGIACVPLAGNRLVTMASPANLLHVLVDGGFAPTTTGNPRPFGMPPFGLQLNDAELAAVASYVRSAWGNEAPQIDPLDVVRVR
jgi:mono/diheme cytochrome c family protein